MNKQAHPHDAILNRLRTFGTTYPGVTFKSPWPGHMDLAVNDKTFAYLNVDGEPLAVGCKLPHSNAMALMFPFCKPTPYGLGKSGWVSASFDGIAAKDIDVDMLKAWIDESYRAQAPKTLVKQLAGGPAAKPARAKPARAKPARAKPARAKPTRKAR